MAAYKCIGYAKTHRHPELTERTIWEVFEAERPKLVPYAGRFYGFHAVPASVSKTCLVAAGIVFWAKGYGDSYLFQTLGNGTYFIARFTNQAWQNITPVADVAAFQQGAGKDNLLRVMTKKQSVSIFVNDQQIAKFRAPVPVGSVKAGFRASSISQDVPAAIEFRDFSVTNVP